MSQLTEDRAVAGFLANRRQLIVQVVKLTKAIEGGHRDIVEALAHRFSQTLIDYLSSGYFRIYGDLLSCQSWSTPRDYAIFESTTSTAMTFADRYATTGSHEAPSWKLANVKSGLADVALALETRFELEDQLLDQRRYHQRHRGERRRDQRHRDGVGRHVRPTLSAAADAAV